MALAKSSRAEIASKQTVVLVTPGRDHGLDALLDLSVLQF